MKIDPRKELYAILDVLPTATQKEIKRAYRRLARRFHPDSGAKEASIERFRDVEEAYRILSDEKTRQAYDKQRAELGIGYQAALNWNIVPSREKLPTGPEEQMFYLLVEVFPAEGIEARRLPLNLCLVIDRSTSMNGERLKYVKTAAHRIVDDLEDDATLSIVGFSDRAEVLMPSSPIADRTRAHASIASMWAGGGTEILHGLKAGLEQLRHRHRDEVVSYLILLTDGRTYGDEEKCLAEARRAGLERIGISALGIGEDWNDAFLDDLVRQAEGVSAYISYPQQILAVLRDQVRGLGGLFARRVQLTLRFSEHAWLASAFRTAPHFEYLVPADGVLTLGTLHIGKLMQVLLEIVVSAPDAQQGRLVQLDLAADLPSLGRDERLLQDVEVEFVADPPKEAVPTLIVNTLGRLSVFRMQKDAWQALEDGRQDEARQRLERVATRLLDMGEDDLAHRVLIEAGRVAQGGRASDKGYKTIKYSTRSLGIG
ncbi:MAG: DnaJ domain-containing protein [Anaerolineae bacterium]|nr:DnaJ domain-containing protein [Anaerolineae bacterium]